MNARRATTYRAVGVDDEAASAGLSRLADRIRATWPPATAAHPLLLDLRKFANVIDLGGGLGIALCADGVGSKVMIAQMTGRYDTVGIDCVAMCVNDLVCVGATPVSFLDYLAVERVEPAFMDDIARGLAEGARLTEVTRELAASLGVKANILPMTDSSIATRVKTPEGELEFQDYFVARGTRPSVCGVRFQGADEARATPEVMRAFDESGAIVFCPSNPIVSIGPILAISDIHERLRGASAPRVGVSPIIGGAALRGPAAEMLRSLGHEVSALGVARILKDVLDGFVVDTEDEALVSSIEETGLRSIALPSIMSDLDSKKKLAQGVLAFASSVRKMS